MIDARDFLDITSGYANSGTSGPKSSADRPIKLGTIDPAYTVGYARVTFDGESTLSVKGYSWVDPYIPTPGDRVYLLPVGQSYLIGGKVSSIAPVARHAEFTSNNFGQQGGNTLWDVGVLTADTGAPGLNDFSVAGGNGNGSITITKTGWYSFQALMVPPGSMGNGWIKIVNTTTSTTLGMGNSSGYAWELFVSTVPMQVTAGAFIKFQTMVTTTQNGVNTRVRVHRHG